MAYKQFTVKNADLSTDDYVDFVTQDDEGFEVVSSDDRVTNGIRKRNLIAKTKNLLTEIKPFSATKVENGVVYQIVADSRELNTFKIQIYNGDTYIKSWTGNVQQIGKNTITFTTDVLPAHTYTVFGLNGEKNDTTVMAPITLENNTTYTLSAYFTNITQGKIVWTNSMLELGSTATSYTPYNYLRSYKKCLKVSNVCQLLDKSKYPATQTVNGVTFTNNGDGTITVNGALAGNTIFYPIQAIKYTFGHVYLLWWSDSNATSMKLETNNGEVQINAYASAIFTAKANRTNNVYIDVYTSYNPDNVIVKPQLFDLTEMYRAGNEPTTVEQFRQDFPEKMYPYSPRCWVESHRTELPCIKTIEFGCRFKPDDPDPAVERITRIGDTIEPWDIEYTKNIGSNITENPFEKIDLFFPQIVYDKYGNKFSRFSKFYTYEEDASDGYHYIWICKKKVRDEYYLPDCFTDFGKEWAYVDIGCYEGSVETVNGTKMLRSKSQKTIECSQNRATYFSWAKNNNYGGYKYAITTVSEWTQILEPLCMIMFGTRNSQAVYTGLAGLDAATKTVAFYDNINQIIYYSTNILSTYKVGYNFAINSSGAPSTYGKIVENGSIVGTIKDGVFVESTTGTTYYYVRFISNWGPQFVTSTEIRPVPTGTTDSINAMCGQVNKNWYTCFKVFGVENYYGNTWKHIFDVTIKDLKPYRCKNLSSWSETSTPEADSNWVGVNYSLPNQNGYVKEIGYDKTNSSLKMTKEIGASTSTYYADYYYQNGNGVKCVVGGGDLNQWGNNGMDYYDVSKNVNVSSWNISARLSRRAEIDG